MSESITQDRVVGAAQDLGKDQFTRADLAEKLDVRRPDIKEGFKAARQSGQLEKVGEDDEGTGLFRLTDK